MRSSWSSLVWLKWLIVEDNWCRSSKSPHMCRGPKQVWEDQIAGGPEKLLALRAEGTIVSRWRSNVGNKTMSKFMRFLGGPNRPKICVRGTKFNFEDWPIDGVLIATFSILSPVSARDHEGRTCLHLAAANDSLPAVTTILKYEVKLLREKINFFARQRYERAKGQWKWPPINPNG